MPKKRLNDQKAVFEEMEAALANIENTFVDADDDEGIEELKIFETTDVKKKTFQEVNVDNRSGIESLTVKKTGSRNSQKHSGGPPVIVHSNDINGQFYHFLIIDQIFPLKYSLQIKVE